MREKNYRRISKPKKSNERHMFWFSNEASAVRDRINRVFFMFKLHFFLVGNHVKELIRDMRRVMEPFTAPNLKVFPVFFIEKFDNFCFSSYSGQQKECIERFHINLRSFSYNTFNDIFKNSIIHVHAFASCASWTDIELSCSSIYAQSRYCLGIETSSNISQTIRTRTIISHEWFSRWIDTRQVDCDYVSEYVSVNQCCNSWSKYNQTMRTSFHGSSQWFNRISSLVKNFSFSFSLVIDSFFSNIKIAPSGISRAAKKLLQGKVPDLSRFNDISDFMYR